MQNILRINFSCKSVYQTLINSRNILRIDEMENTHILPNKIFDIKKAIDIDACVFITMPILDTHEYRVTQKRLYVYACNSFRG